MSDFDAGLKSGPPPTLWLRIYEMPDKTLSLVVEETSGGAEGYLGLPQSDICGLPARHLLAADEQLVDSWLELVLKTRAYGPGRFGAAGGSVTQKSLHFLHAVKEWCVNGVTYNLTTDLVTAQFYPATDEWMLVNTRQLMDIKHRLWLAGFMNDVSGWEIDLPTQTIYLSREMARRLRLARDAVILPLQAFMDLVHPEDRPAVQRAIHEVESTRGMVYNRGVMNDGSLLHFNSFGMPGYSANGYLKRIVGQSRDITEMERTRQELAHSERRFRGIVESSEDLFVVLEPGGSITYVSPNVTRIAGYRPEHVVGQKFRAYIAYKADEDKLEAGFNRVLAAGGHVDGEFLVQRVDGSTIWFSICLSAIPDDAGGVAEVVAVCRDVSEQKQKEENLRYMGSHDALTRLYNRFHFESELERIQREGVVGVGLVMADLNGLKLVNDAFGHQRGDELLAEAARRLCSCCAQHHDVFRVGGDEFAILAYDATPGELEAICDAIAAEMDKTKKRDIPISLSCGTAFRQTRDQSMQVLFKQAEGGMYGNKLLDSHSMRSQVLASLKETLRARNMETADHTQRMEYMVATLGKKLGLPSGEFDRLLLLASMHDIGKVAIPDHIINKPGPLDDGEWEVMRTHSEVGYRIAMTTQELSVIADEIGSHHERWDGGGYPSGLAGDGIPLLSRIISVVDTYDVMTHRRVYKQPRSHADAICELRHNAGSQFDPQIVSLFLDIFGSMTAEEIDRLAGRTVERTQKSQRH